MARDSTADVTPHIHEIDTSADCWADTVDRVVYNGTEYRVTTTLNGDPQLIKDEIEE